MNRSLWHLLSQFLVLTFCIIHDLCFRFALLSIRCHSDALEMQIRMGGDKSHSPAVNNTNASSKCPQSFVAYPICNRSNFPLFSFDTTEEELTRKNMNFSFFIFQFFYFSVGGYQASSKWAERELWEWLIAVSSLEEKTQREKDLNISPSAFPILYFVAFPFRQAKLSLFLQQIAAVFHVLFIRFACFSGLFPIFLASFGSRARSAFLDRVFQYFKFLLRNIIFLVYSLF